MGLAVGLAVEEDFGGVFDGAVVLGDTLFGTLLRAILAFGVVFLLCAAEAFGAVVRVRRGLGDAGEMWLCLCSFSLPDALASAPPSAAGGSASSCSVPSATVFRSAVLVFSALALDDEGPVVSERVVRRP